MTIFRVVTGKVEYESLLGLGRAKEQVLHCEPIEAGDYSITHALLGLDLNIGPDDSVSLPVKSIRKLGGNNRRGWLTFGESIVALDILRDGNEQLSLTPNYGHTALKIGPDGEGVTVSLVRYRSPAEASQYLGEPQAPKDIGQRIAHNFTKTVKTSKSGGGHGSG